MALPQIKSPKAAETKAEPPCRARADASEILAGLRAVVLPEATAREAQRAIQAMEACIQAIDAIKARTEAGLSALSARRIAAGDHFRLLQAHPSHDPQARPARYPQDAADHRQLLAYGSLDGGRRSDLGRQSRCRSGPCLRPYICGR
ncbi:MAG: hypothetical protein H6844_19285 [Alphaproteobacteria bacterium]|nr:hypothetical protein [Alphaproteobacteria bacterium]